MASKAASKAAERFLPWLPLRLAQMPEVGSRTLVFRSEQSVGKIEVKRYLAAMYGLDVSRVDSANHEGRWRRSRAAQNRALLKDLSSRAKQRVRSSWVRVKPYKKFWVTLQQPLTHDDLPHAAEARAAAREGASDDELRRLDELEQAAAEAAEARPMVVEGMRGFAATGVGVQSAVNDREPRGMRGKITRRPTR